MISDEKTRIMLTISKTDLAKLKQHSQELERPVSCLIREAVKGWLQSSTTAVKQPLAQANDHTSDQHDTEQSKTKGNSYEAEYLRRKGLEPEPPSKSKPKKARRRKRK